MAENGDRMVKPMETTPYELVAKGPGGEATQAATIDVNTTPTATLTLSQPEERNHTIGDKLVLQDSATLVWSVSNASRVTLNPVGNVAPVGEPKHHGLAEPKQRRPHQSRGHLHAQRGERLRGDNDANRNPAYRRLDRSSTPGDAGERLLSHRVSGTKTSEHRSGLQSGTGAGQGSGHLQEQPAVRPGEPKADGRGTCRRARVREIQPGSDRTARREIVKEYLISQGIAADKIEIRAEGKDKQLDQKKVEELGSLQTRKHRPRG